MLTWIKKMFSEGDEVSSKRFVGIAGSVSLIATMVYPQRDRPDPALWF